MFRIFYGLIASLAMFGTTASAQDIRYTLARDLSINDQFIEAGTSINVLGVLPVDEAVAESGQLVTFRYDGSVHIPQTLVHSLFSKLVPRYFSGHQPLLMMGRTHQFVLVLRSKANRPHFLLLINALS